ncbi:MAG: hypothetical protein ABFD12_07805 [Syntrophorhabdus sp.]
MLHEQRKNWIPAQKIAGMTGVPIAGVTVVPIAGMTVVPLHSLEDLFPFLP